MSSWKDLRRVGLLQAARMLLMYVPLPPLQVTATLKLAVEDEFYRSAVPRSGIPARTYRPGWNGQVK